LVSRFKEAKPVDIGTIIANAKGDESEASN
jgi:hypothetical protein